MIFLSLKSKLQKNTKDEFVINYLIAYIIKRIVEMFDTHYIIVKKGLKNFITRKNNSHNLNR